MVYAAPLAGRQGTRSYLARCRSRWSRWPGARRRRRGRAREDHLPPRVVDGHHETQRVVRGVRPAGDGLEREVTERASRAGELHCPCARPPRWQTSCPCRSYPGPAVHRTTAKGSHLLRRTGSGSQITMLGRPPRECRALSLCSDAPPSGLEPRSLYARQRERARLVLGARNPLPVSRASAPPTLASAQNFHHHGVFLQRSGQKRALLLFVGIRHRRHLDRPRHKEMSASAAAFPAPSAATVSYRRHGGARPGGAAFGRRWNRPAAPAPPGRHRTERSRKTALRENAAVVSGARSAVPTGDDEPSTFPKPSFRGLHTLARTLGNAEPASTPSSSAPAAASAYGFHFGSFPLEAFPDTFASNVIPLFRARKGGVVARARAADDGADAKKERSGEDVEDASDGDSDSDDDAYDIPDTTRGSSGDSGDPAPGRPKKANEESEEDDSERGVSLKKEKERRAFFKSRPELARSVVTFSETAEMLCLLTAGGVRVAQLTQMGRERRLPFQAAAGPKRSVAFVAAAARAGAARPPRYRSAGWGASPTARSSPPSACTSCSGGSWEGTTSCLSGTSPGAGGRRRRAVRRRRQPRARARRAPRRRQEGPRVLAPAGGDRRQGGGPGRESGRGHSNTDTDTDRARRGGRLGRRLGVPEPRGSAARGAAGARSAEATARHREVEVSAAKARGGGGGDGAGGARARGGGGGHAEPP